MRLRSSSIRAKVIALLMVPIVALVALWIYATLATTGDVWTQLQVADTYTEFGGSVEQYAHDLQDERRAAVQRLADPRSQAAADAFQKTQTITDRDAQVLRLMADGSAAKKMDAGQRAKYQDILHSANDLAALRSQINRSALSWDYVLGQYSDLIKPTFAFRSAFVSRQSGQLPRQGTILIELVRAREYLSQEDAAMEGLRTSTGRTTPSSTRRPWTPCTTSRRCSPCTSPSSTRGTRATTPRYAAATTGRRWSAPSATSPAPGATTRSPPR